MKYLVMIRRGHVPMWGARVNRDVEPFLKYFLPKGTPANLNTLHVVVCHLHLAFKKMRTEEIYDVLMEQLVKAIHKYDPGYTEKVRLVVEKIDHELSQQPRFSTAELNRYLEFDSHRYVRLLCRRGFLAPVFGRDRKITGFERKAWPVPQDFLEKGPIGLAYYLVPKMSRPGRNGRNGFRTAEGYPAVGPGGCQLKSPAQPVTAKPD